MGFEYSVDAQSRKLSLVEDLLVQIMDLKCAVFLEYNYILTDEEMEKVRTLSEQIPAHLVQEPIQAFKALVALCDLVGKRRFPKLRDPFTGIEIE